MKTLAILFTLIFAGTSFANLRLAPPPFDHANDDAVFVDFLKAEHTITVDVADKTMTANSKITFRMERAGYPLFDLVPNPDLVSLKGEPMTAPEINLPGNISRMRTLNVPLSAGEYTLEISNRIRTNVTFEDGSVEARFSMLDLSDRKFLEQYLPTNLEYDQYPMSVTVKFTGPHTPVQIFTNGTLSGDNNNGFKIVCPGHFNASSFYFHMLPKGKFPTHRFDYRSISGRSIKAVVYGKLPFLNDFFLDQAKRKTRKMLETFEVTYGAYAYDSFIAHIDRYTGGGMEYVGATTTSLAALDHELLHSYFSRGVMPSNGNSAWIDEAIATWWDNDYKQMQTVEWQTLSLMGNSPYLRVTNRDAYKKGSQVMSHLDFRMRRKGGLRKFLKQFYEENKMKVITAEQFFKAAEAFAGVSFNYVEKKISGSP